MTTLSPGFTFVEVILATFITGVVVITGNVFWTTYSNNLSYQQEISRNVADAENVLTQMANEAKEMRDGANGAYPLETTNDNELTFYSDVNGDLVPDRIRYYKTGTTLNRGITLAVGVPPAYNLAQETTTILSSHVVNDAGTPIFSYYNGNWPGDVTNNPLIASRRPLQTRYIRFVLHIETTTNFAAPAVELTDGVQIRNLKDNL